MATGLSEAQTRALLALVRAGAPRSAYPQIALTTMESLEKLGMVKADRSKLGSMAMPANKVMWSITKKGRRSIAIRAAKGTNPRITQKGVFVKHYAPMLYEPESYPQTGSCIHHWRTGRIVYITSGSRFEDGTRVSNFFTWQDVNADGSLDPNEQSGYWGIPANETMEAG